MIKNSCSIQDFNYIGDKYLIHDILENLSKQKNISKHDAIDLMENSNFLNLLKTRGHFVHHESPSKWVKHIIWYNKEFDGGLFTHE